MVRARSSSAERPTRELERSKPGWRNGRRSGLKIRRPQGRAGSTPALGTNKNKHFRSFRALTAGAVSQRCHSIAPTWGKATCSEAASVTECDMATIRERIKKDGHADIPVSGPHRRLPAEDRDVQHEA